MAKGRLAPAQWAMWPLERSWDWRKVGGSMKKMKKSKSYAADKRKLLARLNRIEGQVRGLARMVEDDRYCMDILQQIASLRAAADAVARTLLRDHIQGCLLDAAGTEEEGEKIDEVVELVRRYSRS